MAFVVGGKAEQIIYISFAVIIGILFLSPQQQAISSVCIFMTV